MPEWIKSHRKTMQYVNVCCLLLFSVVAGRQIDWSGVEHVLDTAIGNAVMPGCAAAVTLNGEVVFSKAFGNFTYGKAAPRSGKNEPTTTTTKFDLARFVPAVMLLLALLLTRTA